MPVIIILGYIVIGVIVTALAMSFDKSDIEEADPAYYVVGIAWPMFVVFAGAAGIGWILMKFVQRLARGFYWLHTGRFKQVKRS